MVVTDEVMMNFFSGSFRIIHIILLGGDFFVADILLPHVFIREGIDLAWGGCFYILPRFLVSNSWVRVLCA